MGPTVAPAVGNTHVPMLDQALGQRHEGAGVFGSEEDDPLVEPADLGQLELERLHLGEELGDLAVGLLAAQWRKEGIQQREVGGNAFGRDGVVERAVMADERLELRDGDDQARLDLDRLRHRRRLVTHGA